MDTFMKIDNSQGSVLTFIFKQAARRNCLLLLWGALIYEKVAAWKRHPIKQLCWQEHYKVGLWVEQTITDCNYVHYCLSELLCTFFGGVFALIPSSALRTHLCGLTFPREWDEGEKILLVSSGSTPKRDLFSLYGVKEVTEIIPACTSDARRRRRRKSLC